MLLVVADWLYPSNQGGVMVSKLDYQTFMSEYKSHWVLHSYDLLPHVSKIFS